jgi:predicted DNA-binding ribbon-helix-helix protein
MRFSDEGSGGGTKPISHPQYTTIKKRSIVLDGLRTSISLEDRFWQCLRAIAFSERVNTSALVAQINAKRGKIGLSSAVRQFVFCHHVGDAPPPHAREGGGDGSL